MNCFKAIFCRVALGLLLCLAICFASAQAQLVFKPSTQAQSGVQQGKEALVLVGFGSTRPEALTEYNQGVLTLESLVREKVPSLEILRAFSSRHFLRSTQGQSQGTRSLEQTLADLAAKGYSRVFVQSLHITSGQEYQDLQEITVSFSHMPKGLQQLTTSSPLIGSAADAQKLADTLVREEKSDSGEAVVFVGHGGRKGADLSLLALQAALWRLSPEYCVLSLESEPGFALLEERLKALGVKKVRLVPLLAVAGEHVLNDIGGLEGRSSNDASVFTRLEKLGYKCSVRPEGLFSREAVLRLWRDKILFVVEGE